MFTILSHQGKENQIDFEIPSYTFQKDNDQKHKWKRTLVKVWNMENTSSLLGMQTCTVTLQINLVVSKNWESVYLYIQQSPPGAYTQKILYTNFFLSVLDQELEILFSH